MNARTARNTLVLILLCGLGSGWSNPLSGPDCTLNEECNTAIYLGTPVSDQSAISVDGCNLFASSNEYIIPCHAGYYPTVWYSFTTDAGAKGLSVDVTSDDFENPTITVFMTLSGCDGLIPVQTSGTNLACVIGGGGKASIIAGPIESNTTYYIAVSSLYSIGGNFRMDIRSLNKGFVCVKKSEIEIVARSNGGPLEGPFDPNETVSVCLKVLEYTAANNGCQWFQGLVPVFGNGWDPNSFDNKGQPLNATVNGHPIPEDNNGLYGTAKWDWFDDVDYHHDEPQLTIGDFDGNGRVEMCNSYFDPNCPVMGVLGGCCNPCWGSPEGDILPPGWFAYGINGSCPDPGPPVRVDWGDGNSCGGGMGPWHFCFDLVTRDISDCNSDSTTKDLSLGFYTFSDGETGAWTGSASVCQEDAPIVVTLEATCGRVATGDIEELPQLCSGDTLVYTIEDPDVIHWEWNISPFWAVQYLINEGDNGFTIHAPLINTSDETITVKAIFIGHEADPNNKVIKQFKFELQNEETCTTVSIESGTEISNMIKVFPVPVLDAVVLEWSFDLQDRANVSVFDAQGRRINDKTVFPGDGQRTQIDTNGWPAGVYYVRFGNATFQSTAKMVKQ